MTQAKKNRLIAWGFWSLVAFASLGSLSSAVFGGMREIRDARDAGNMQLAIQEAKSYYPSATAREKEQIEEMMQEVYRRRAEQQMIARIKATGRIDNRTAIDNLRSDGTATFRLKPEDVPAPPTFSDKVITVVTTPVEFVDSETQVLLEAITFADKVRTVVTSLVEFTDAETQVLLEAITFADAVAQVVVETVTFNDKGIGTGIAAYLYGLVGATAARDAAIASLGLPPPGPTTAPPTFFVAMASYNTPTTVAADRTLNYPVKVIRLLEDVAGNPLDGLDAGDKVIVIADHAALNQDVAAALNDAKVQLIVVGHYKAADVAVSAYAFSADEVKVDIALLRAVTAKPLFLAVSTINFIDGIAYPPWAAEFDAGTFDGFAVYNLVHWGAFEQNKLAGTRAKLGLENKPMIVLDFIGGGYYEGLENLTRLDAQWRRKAPRAFARIKGWGWRGVVVWSPDQASADVKARWIPNDLRFIP
jgi:hypothetical protein